MEETLPKKAFDKAAYNREYQRKRYHSDTVFKQKQIDHVKKLYKENQDLLRKYKEELKLKEISNITV